MKKIETASIVNDGYDKIPKTQCSGVESTWLVHLLMFSDGETKFLVAGGNRK